MQINNGSPSGPSRRDFIKLTAASLGALLLPRFSLPPSVQKDGKIPPINTQPITDRRALARSKRIKVQGVATRAMALEFHGDHYYMYSGAYCMDPETFVYLMEWLRDNDVWAMNGEELVGYINGTMDMPARSIILTTDSGNTSKDSLARMIPVLQNTGLHFISFIWTRHMLGSEHERCASDSCWEAFRAARDSGVFTFGSHTESHRDFATLPDYEGIRDILQSKAEIEENLGVVPTLLSWPFESVPRWASSLRDHGFEGAFAGAVRFPMVNNVVLPNEPQVWTMPRLLPPNVGTLTSGRPSGLTIEEMMAMFCDGFD
ncbi:MAG: polysaccharide deacetylase family protein [Anaerolineales bacterium]|jgi:peptidoglycan/xylan/chitin deacetylase (PgdA/CDA1 family)